MKLRYVMTDEVRSLGLRSTVVAEVEGLHITHSNDELEELKRSTAANVLELQESDLDSNEILQSYRTFVQALGRSSKKFPPAAEGLIKQIRRTGCFPTINTAVDSYNIVAAHRFLAIGVHDRSRIDASIIFRKSAGGERFIAVGAEAEKATQPGDVVYADQSRVLAWLDAKDSDEVKVSEDTTEMVIVIQGTDTTTREYTRSALLEACELIHRFCGGTYDIAAVD